MGYQILLSVNIISELLCEKYHYIHMLSSDEVDFVTVTLCTNEFYIIIFFLFFVGTHVRCSYKIDTIHDQQIRYSPKTYTRVVP